MRGYDVIEALGGIGDDLILDAKRWHKKPIPVWLRFGAVAACLCCVVMAAAVLSLNLFGRDRTPGQEALGSGMERINAVDVTPKTDDPENIGNEDRLLTDSDHVILEDEEFGLKLEVPKSMAQDVVCNPETGVLFALYEPTSEAARPGSECGFVWDIRVFTVDAFLEAFQWDMSDWCEDAVDAGIYMLGFRGDHIYALQLPMDERATEETREAYAQYRERGRSIVRRFQELNGIGDNSRWEEYYPTSQNWAATADQSQETAPRSAQSAEAPLNTETQTEPESPAQTETPNADAARDAGVYARDKAYSSKAEGVPIEALEEFTVWFESPASDGREKFCTDPWSWTFTVTEGTDLAQWGDVVLECSHENGIDSQMFFWSWGGTVTWGPTSSLADP